jgi:two-component system phosphate regulon response regulator PhoB
VRVSAALKGTNAGPVVRASSTRRIAVIIHPGRREVLVNGNMVPLTFTEFGILSCLATKPGWVFTRDQLLDAARGEDNNTLDCSVNGHIASLRKKLGEAGGLIETVRGAGYRLKDLQG